jgi:hypothetical protein
VSVSASPDVASGRRTAAVRVLRDVRDAVVPPLAPADDRPGGRELALACAALLGLTAAVYVPYALEAGFYGEDWTFVEEGRFESLGLSALLDHLRGVYRPLGSAVQYLIFGVAEDSAAVYALHAAALTALQCMLLYLVLRLLRLRPAVAAGPALLLVVLPSADAARLWPGAQVGGLGVDFYLGGVVVALLGLRAGSTPRRVACHALAIALYLCASLTYELVAPLVVVTPVLYAVAAGRRSAARRFPFDAAAVGAFFLHARSGALETRGGGTSPRYLAERVEDIWSPTVEALRFALPVDRLLWGPVGLTLALIAAVGIGRALGDGGWPRVAVRTWSAAALLALLFALAGLVLLLPADEVLVPAWQGAYNRLFVAASLGGVVLLTGSAWLVALGVASLMGRPRMAPAGALAVLAVIAGGLLRQELRNQDAWVRAADEEERIVAVAKRALGPRPPREVGIALFHHANFSPERVPLWSTSWDLQSRLRVLYGNRRLRAHPYELPVRCEATRAAYPEHGGPAERSDELTYGRLWFVDVRNGATTRIRTQADCSSAVLALTGTPG